MHFRANISRRRRPLRPAILINLLSGPHDTGIRRRSFDAGPTTMHALFISKPSHTQALHIQRAKRRHRGFSMLRKPRQHSNSSADQTLGVESTVFQQPQLICAVNGEAKISQATTQEATRALPHHDHRSDMWRAETIARQPR